VVDLPGSLNTAMSPELFYGDVDVGSIATASIALNLRGKFSDCGK
jgi:hypothetical protein